jgi:hypothetical protein
MADIGKELFGIEMEPEATVKPLLKVGVEFTVHDLFEFSPILVLQLKDATPPETVSPFENVCILVHMLEIDKDNNPEIDEAEID